MLVNFRNTAQSKRRFRNKEIGESKRRYKCVQVSSQNTAQSKGGFINEIGECKRRYKGVLEKAPNAAESKAVESKRKYQRLLRNTQNTTQSKDASGLFV